MKLPTSKWFVLSGLLLGMASANAGSPPPPPAPVPAPSPLSYDFIEASYVHGWADNDFDIFDEQDGYQINLNTSLSSNLYLFAGFGQLFSDESTTIDTFFGDLDFEGDLDSLGAELGIGFHLPLTQNIDWIAEVGGTYDRAELDLSASAGGVTVDFDDVADVDGFGVTASTGVRIAITTWLELDLTYNFRWRDWDGEVLDEDVSLGEEEVHYGKARLIFRNLGNSNVDLVLAGAFSDDLQTASAGIRYNF